uniref:NADH-ubiquinone oxidoreductase chain 3 n=1 Tax=Nipponnemertes punctatula TaxID=1332184 RepID=X2C8D3_9BILA|nr:NADH dehydrogenase subunit 3 [Nipponnemertes punctatula]AGL46768.1 NADH dehydrogenase subunit 3 [Nipponnemertes punctatula]
MGVVFVFFSFSLVLSVVVWLISFFLSKRVYQDFEKNTPFECGFDPNLSARVPFSMRFFLLAVLFLIFDVEIVLLMPLSLVLSWSFWISGMVMGVFFLVILVVGLFHEWKEGSLNWVY